MAGLSFRPLPSCGLLGDIPLARYAPFSPGIRPAGYGRVSPAWAAVHSNPAHRSGSPSSLLCWVFLAAHHVTSGRPRPCISPPYIRCTADQTPVAMRRLAGMCRGLTVPRRYKIGDMPPSGVGAPNGFCHRDIGLEDRYFTCKLPTQIVFLPSTSLLFYHLLHTFLKLPNCFSAR